MPIYLYLHLYTYAYDSNETSPNNKFSMCNIIKRKPHQPQQVVKLLLHNKHEWTTGIEVDESDGTTRVAKDHPILVVCYTNHALDQFLEGIHEFHPKGIVRVGGRSQSEIMQKCSLGELKHAMHKNKEG